MCLQTVAHQRGSGEFIRFGGGSGGGDDGDEEHASGHDGGSSGTSQSLGFNQMMEQGEVAMQGSSSMVSGYSRAREFTEMVSALTHVVSGSGQRSSEWVQRSGFPMMSGFGHVSSSSPHSSMSSFTSSSATSGPALVSGSWVGHKRGREEVSGASYQLMQQPAPTRLFRNIGDFRVPTQGESSSGAVANFISHTSSSIKHFLHIT